VSTAACEERYYVAVMKMRSDDRDAWLGFAVILGVTALALWQFFRSGRTKRDLARTVYRTSATTVLLLTVLSAMFYIALRFFDRWNVLWALVVETEVVILTLYVVYWVRYPGIFQSKSASVLIRDVMRANLSLLLIPFYVVVGFTHLGWLFRAEMRRIPENLDYRVGLGFRYDKGATVRLSAGLPDTVGEIVRIRVIRRGEITAGPPFDVGTVLYMIKFHDGQSIEVPEASLVS